LGPHALKYVPSSFGTFTQTSSSGQQILNSVSPQHTWSFGQQRSSIAIPHLRSIDRHFLRHVRRSFDCELLLNRQLVHTWVFSQHCFPHCSFPTLLQFGTQSPSMHRSGFLQHWKYE
jgi:hypothetical protein